MADRREGIAAKASRSSQSAARAKLAGLNAFAAVECRLEARRIRVGSAPGNNLVLEHKSVSGKHALIRRSFERYVIEDLGSSNGTFINGMRIKGAHPLRPGDEVRFGAARFAMVGGKAPGAPIAKYVTLAAALLVLAVAGYLSFEFVTNWENLEKLTANPTPATTMRAGASGVPNAAASPASTAATANHVQPSPAVGAPLAPLAALAGPAPAWLAAINEYRAAVKLPPVAEDPKLSDADRKHAIYVVKNYADKVGPDHLLGAAMHDEEKGNPWYTPEGQAAGEHSDVNQHWGNDTPPTPSSALNNWISGPFHRLWILNPRLRRVGYGEFCEKKFCVAALDLGGGTEPARGAEPLASPIEFPPDNSSTPILAFAGEWPTPLTACGSFSFPAGMPATIQLGAGVDAKLADYSITREGHGVESCGIDAVTYQNPVASEQERGRAILRELGAVIIIPKYPLKPGARYTVSATLNNRNYQWSFMTAGGSPSSATSTPTASISPRKK